MEFRSKIITLPSRYGRPSPEFEKHDIKFPDALVRYFLHEFTSGGDRVLDPFTGLGTTFFVCEKMGRIPYGVEADKKRHAWVSQKVKKPEHLVLGDSFDVRSFGFPKMDFSITSPPYMPKGHRWNPLVSGNPKYAGYVQYHQRLKSIYKSLSTIMKRGACIVVQADNLEGKQYTPLAWDIAETLQDVFRLEGEIIVNWKSKKIPSPSHTHCLVFKNI